MQINNIKTDFSFKSHFITFISQALRTILIDFYEYITDDGNFISFPKFLILEQFHDLNVIPLKLINYINYCWHLYNKVGRTDDYIYIISKLDKMKFTGKFKHNYCLFDLIWNFSLKALIYILGRIDIETIERKDFFIKRINDMLDSFSNFDEGDIEKFENENCCFECELEKEKQFNYNDKEDFIKVKYLKTRY